MRVTVCQKITDTLQHNVCYLASEDYWHITAQSVLTCVRRLLTHYSTMCVTLRQKITVTLQQNVCYRESEDYWHITA